MRGKLLISSFTLLCGVVGALSLQQPAQALDSSRDPDQYAVVYNGTMSVSEIKDNYNKKDHAAVFSAFGISKSELGGDIRDGIVYQDGRVVVDGKTVATGAVMAARHLGGSSISGSDTAKKVSVSKMSDAQTAFVKFDANGNFLWAIMKPCGNPVTATPPKPKPTPAAACKSLTATPLSRTQYRLSAEATKENGATISNYTFTVKSADGNTVRTKEKPTESRYSYTDVPVLAPGTYSASVVVTTSVGAKTAASCNTSFTIAPPADNDIPVCELATKKTITIKESEYDTSKHSKDFADCNEVPSNIEVCDLATKKRATIKESEFDSSKHSKNFADCQEKETPCPIPGKEALPADSEDCEETPVQLPETGFADTFTKLLGVVSLTGASAYFLTSKR
jgi:hypothetical protein